MALDIREEWLTAHTRTQAHRHTGRSTPEQTPQSTSPWMSRGASFVYRKPFERRARPMRSDAFGRQGLAETLTRWRLLLLFCHWSLLPPFTPLRLVKRLA